MLETAELEPIVSEVYPGTQAVVRAIALLKAFSDTQPERSLGELSVAVGLNKTTAYRLLSALEAEGLLLRSGTAGSYRLGPELIALGSCAVRSNPIRMAARPVLETLAAESDESATLEIRAGDQVLIVDEISSRHLMGMSQDVGSRLPLHATATGKVLLAFAPDGLPPRSLHRVTERTITVAVLLEEQLVQTRRQGYAITDGELEPGFGAIAAPVFNREGEVVAAVSIGGASLRLHEGRRAELIALVQMAARQVSRQVGYRPG